MYIDDLLPYEPFSYWGCGQVFHIIIILIIVVCSTIGVSHNNNNNNKEHEKIVEVWGSTYQLINFLTYVGQLQCYGLSWSCDISK